MCFGISLILDLTGQSSALVITGIICGWVSLATTSIIAHMYEEVDDE
jgi:hypothetical protein|tara:strand:+ start:2507 stop:2647 length:141 start_codon:yes stop_codon:yes gene_type:complete